MADAPRTFHVVVSAERIREHQRELGLDWAIVALLSGLVLAADLFLELRAFGPESEFDLDRLGVHVPEPLATLVLAAVVVVQFASGAGLFVGIRLWREAVRRNRVATEELTLTITERHVAVRRDARVIHEAAELLAARAFPSWIELTVREAGAPVRFALPLSPVEHRNLLAFLRDDRAIDVRARRSWVLAFAIETVARSAGSVAAHVLVTMLALALLVGVGEAIALAYRFGGVPGAAAVALVVVALVVVVRRRSARAA